MVGWKASPVAPVYHHVGDDHVADGDDVRIEATGDPDHHHPVDVEVEHAPRRVSRGGHPHGREHRDDLVVTRSTAVDRAVGLELEPADDGRQLVLHRGQHPHPLDRRRPHQVDSLHHGAYPWSLSGVTQSRCWSRSRLDAPDLRTSDGNSAARSGSCRRAGTQPQTTRRARADAWSSRAGPVHAWMGGRRGPFQGVRPSP
jgi:hypothetical protein